MRKKTDYEVKLTIGLYGIAITELYDPEGLIEMDLQSNDVHDWYDTWIRPLMDDELEVGTWHLKGTMTAFEDDCKYTLDYQMPDQAV
ncbi:hypothetical protein [Endozoicomonas sp. ALC066]|uniref:hypothetical protein n=1 Tax=Endozoicomonas sp. ALC066 TaxID=3403078 RepID=UPI003BB78A22